MAETDDFTSQTDNNLWACLPFWFLLTAINIFQQLSLKPLHQLHQIVTTTSLHNLARLPGAIVTKLDNTSNCFELGSYFKQAVASQQANSFA